MKNRIDIAISKALSARLLVNNAVTPLSTATGSSDTIHGTAMVTIHGAAALTIHGAVVPLTIHGAASFTIHGAGAPPSDPGGVEPLTIHGAAAPLTIHGAAAVPPTIHGAIVLPLPTPQMVSRVEIAQAPNGDLIVSLHEE